MRVLLSYCHPVCLAHLPGESDFVATFPIWGDNLWGDRWREPPGAFEFGTGGLFHTVFSVQILGVIVLKGMPLFFLCDAKDVQIKQFSSSVRV